MPIVIKEIQVKTTVERNPVNPVLVEKTIQQLKQEIIAELRISGMPQNKKRKER